MSLKGIGNYLKQIINTLINLLPIYALIAALYYLVLFVAPVYPDATQNQIGYLKRSGYLAFLLLAAWLSSHVVRIAVTFPFARFLLETVEEKKRDELSKSLGATHREVKNLYSFINSVAALPILGVALWYLLWVGYFYSTFGILVCVIISGRAFLYNVDSILYDGIRGITGVILSLAMLITFLVLAFSTPLLQNM